MAKIDTGFGWFENESGYVKNVALKREYRDLVKERRSLMGKIANRLDKQASAATPAAAAELAREVEMLQGRLDRMARRVESIGDEVKDAWS